MKRALHIFGVLSLCLAAMPLLGQSVPEIAYDSAPNLLKMPDDIYLGEVLGVATNLAFLARVAADPDFAAGSINTGFIERRRRALLPAPRPTPDIALAAAALHRLLARQQARTDIADPWARVDAWRLNVEPAPPASQ